MKNISNAIKAELIKTRHTAIGWVTIIAALFAPFSGFLLCTIRTQVMQVRFGKDFWEEFMKYCWFNMNNIILPIYTILIVGMIVNIEHRNHTWKQVFLTPRTYLTNFLSKILLINFYCIICLFLFNIFLISLSILLGRLFNGFHVSLQQTPGQKMLSLTAFTYLAIVPTILIQYWISLRFKNVVISLGIGFVGWIVSSIIQSWNGTIYFPYAYPGLIQNMFFGGKGTAIVYVVACLTSGLLAATGAYFNVYYMTEKT